MANVLQNGINRGWADLQLILFGVPVVGITDITYSVKQEKTNEYGQGFEPTSRGRGKKTYEGGKLTLYREEWDAIIQNAPNKNPNEIPPFEIQLLFAPTSGGQASIDVIQNVEFTEDNFSSKSGDTALMVDVPFIYAGLKHL